MPRRDDSEIFGRVSEILGNDHMRVECEDGQTRLGRIRGKIKKRMWIRLGEIVLVVPWDWETSGGENVTNEGQGRCDIIWRYQMTQARQLWRRGILPVNLGEAMGFAEEEGAEDAYGRPRAR